MLEACGVVYPDFLLDSLQSSSVEFLSFIKSAGVLASHAKPIKKGRIFYRLEAFTGIRLCESSSEQR